MSAPPGHDSRPQASPEAAESLADDSTVTQAPDVRHEARETVAMVDGKQARILFTFDDLHAAFCAGVGYRVDVEIDQRADELASSRLLAQAGDWRDATLRPAAQKGPAWAEAMRQVIDK